MKRHANKDNWRDVNLNLDQSPTKVKQSRSIKREVKPKELLIRQIKHHRKQSIEYENEEKKYDSSIAGETNNKIKGINYNLTHLLIEVYDKYPIEFWLRELQTPILLQMKNQNHVEVNNSNRQDILECIQIRKNKRKQRIINKMIKF